MSWQPRIGLVSVRFQLFDPQMPADFPDRMHARGRRFAELLSKEFDVAYSGLIEDEASAHRAAEHLRLKAPLDVVVFAPSMAAPPGFAISALDGTTAPVVIWNPVESHRLREDLTQAQATEHTTSVGCLMLANVLLRLGRPASVVTAAPDDERAMKLLRRTVRAAAAAGSLAGSLVLRLGEPVPGYLDVASTADELAALGLKERSVSRDELEGAFAAVPEDRVDELLADLGSRWRGTPGPTGPGSARLALALDGLMDRARAICGTVNCHGPLFRDSARIGIPACLGVSLLTESGRPMSCTGDQPTAVALLLARRLAGAALYSECYAPELETGLMLLAAGGEGDPAWADPPGAVTIEVNDHYPGKQGAGASIAFALRQGPATVLSLSPSRAGWTLAWATGEVVETRYRNMRGPNGMFRFDSGPSGEAISRWIGSGATHHNALAPGRLDIEIPVLAAALGVQQVRC